MTDTATSLLNRVNQWMLDALAGIVEILGYPFAALSLIRAAAQAEAQTDMNQIRATYRDIPLDPALLAEMVMRDILDEPGATAEAAMSALNAERFNQMVQTVGEPPGLMQMASLWRRGLITDEWFDRAIRYSRVRNEFIPNIKDMAHDTMSQAEALEAAVKGVMPVEESKRLFIMAGGLADQFQTLLDTSGNAIGVEAVERLWLHGLATSEDVHRTILHSRINPLFEELATKLYHRYLTGFQIRTIVSAGGATVEEATKWLIDEGYPPDQAASFVKAVAHGTAQKVHDISEAQILELYQAHFVTVEEAKQVLGHLGYAPSVQSYLLEMLDAKRSLDALNQGVTFVRKAYLAGRINENQAQIQLGALEVPVKAVTAYLAAWKVERAAEFKTLTWAEVGSAVKKGFITDSDALTRWAAMGYDPADAAISLALHGGPPPPGAPGIVKVP